MSRSGYSDDCENLELYRGTVTLATRGKRGQKMFRDLKAALEAMPKKELIAHELESDGNVCAFGALGRAMEIDISNIDPDDTEMVGGLFDIARQLAAEVVHMNDEWGRHDESPAERWVRMLTWVDEQIIKVVKS